jgi:hypothetical protein
MELRLLTRKKGRGTVAYQPQHDIARSSGADALVPFLQAYALQPCRRPDCIIGHDAPAFRSL